MSPGRVLLAGIVGGIAMFVWGAISHMALPLGEMGLKNLPAESVLMPTMKTTIKEHGFYFFPPMNEKDQSEEAQKAWLEKYRTGPRGILIYDPVGGEMMDPKQLITEFFSNMVCAILMAVVLANVQATRGKKIMLGTAIGLFAAMSISVSQWNWYRFPSAITIAETIDQTVGGLVTGAAIALVLGRDRRAEPLIG